ncbi:class I SAM-dependent methyltransferase [Streptomyces sp. NPDC007162]|uniref:class I SAM-dependent methyltransferase n=1 Tax=Streptomyces sp. NPDC007162 TaxID=3156917 RepID=UPI0033EC2171
MSDLDSQTAYMPWLDDVDGRAAILDYGCGYGRTMQALERQGFTDLSGVDTSPGMISRARTLHPTMHFAVLDAPPVLAHPDASLDVVLLFAVLTCVPGNDAQRRLVGELSRVLKPGGVLYLSDLLLQGDRRNRDRYARCAERYGTYGVFETGDGAVCRHHPSDGFTSLLAGFEIADTRRITVATMNGHESKGIQILARRGQLC